MKKTLFIFLIVQFLIITSCDSDNDIAQYQPKCYITKYQKIITNNNTFF